MKHEDIKMGDKLIMRWPLDHREVEVTEIRTDFILVKPIDGFGKGWSIATISEWLEPIKTQTQQQ